MAIKTFLPRKSGVSKHRSNYTDRDRAQIQNEVLAHWDARGHSVTVDGIRYSKMYHPADVLADLIAALEDDGCGIPLHFKSWRGIQKWIKKHIHLYYSVHIPHLQAKRKWGTTSSIVAYEGRRGFTGLERNAIYSLMLKVYSEVVYKD